MDSFEQLLFGNINSLKFFALSLTKNPVDAEDLVQTTVERIIKNENRFEMGTNFAAWSKTVMRNIFISGYRKRRIRGEVDLAIVENGTQSRFSHVSNAGEENVNIAFLKGKIASLNDAVRIPFEMFMEGYHYDEISKELNLNIGTIKSRIFTARKILKNEVEELRA